MALQDFYKKYPTQTDCIKYLEKILWNNIPKCPYCGSTNKSNVKNPHRYHCNNCNTTYSVMVGTMFHKTKIDLQKWFYVIAEFKTYESVRYLGEMLDITKDSAARMIGQIHRFSQLNPDLKNKIIETNK